MNSFLLSSQKLTFRTLVRFQFYKHKRTKRTVYSVYRLCLCVCLHPLCLSLASTNPHPTPVPPQTSLGAALILAGAQLKVLDLSDNAFGPDGVRGIETLLKSSACHTLQELRLNNCGMGIGGGKVRGTFFPFVHTALCITRCFYSTKL